MVSRGRAAKSELHPVRHSGGDSLELVSGERLFDHSPSAWLVGEAVRHLNAAGPEAELCYRRAVELLGVREDRVETLARLYRSAPPLDRPLRWSLLHLLGEVGDPAAAKLLAQVIAEPLSDGPDGGECETIADGELLVRTMAVEALARIAVRFPDARMHLLVAIASGLPQPLLVEVVKAARELGLAAAVAKRLPEAQRWMLEIRPVAAGRLDIEAGRAETGERSFRPPRLPAGDRAPRVSGPAPDGRAQET